MFNLNTFGFSIQASILSIPEPGPEIKKVNKAIKRVRFIISDEWRVVWALLYRFIPKRKFFLLQIFFLKMP